MITWYEWTTRAHATASTVLRGSRIPERTRSAEDTLERHGQERFTKMERGRGSGPRRTRMASECGAVCPNVNI